MPLTHIQKQALDAVGYPDLNLPAPSKCEVGL